MDKDAIQLIQDTAVTAALIPSEAMHIVALPQSASVHDLEKYLPDRRRFRGKLETTVLDSFVDYVKAGSSATCFIDTDAMKAVALFNLGTRENPGHCDDMAIINLQLTAPMTALRSFNGKLMSQKELAEWMEDWHTHISAASKDGNEMPLAKAIAAVRAITIESASKSEHKDDDFKAARTAMESIEAKSKDGLPAFLHFSCIPYNGLMQRTFILRISVLTSHEKPVLKYLITQLEVQQEEMAKEFQGLIQDKLAGTTIYQGLFTG